MLHAAATSLLVVYAVASHGLPCVRGALLCSALAFSRAHAASCACLILDFSHEPFLFLAHRMAQRPAHVAFYRVDIGGGEGYTFPCLQLLNRRGGGAPVLLRWVYQRSLELLLFIGCRRAE